MLALEVAPEGLTEFLARRSEGNPFFVAEYLRTAVDSTLLWRDEQGRWRLGPGIVEPDAADYERLELPASLRDLVGRRLAALSPSARYLAQLAAILGREISLPLLEEFLRLCEPEEDSVWWKDAWTELARREWIVETGARALRFSHETLREGAYEQNSQKDRSRFHRMAARSLESVYAADLSDYWGELGFHWERACDIDRAQASYLRAGRRARKGYALVEARQSYQDYLRLVTVPTSEAIRVRNEYGYGVLYVQGLMAEAERAHGDALAEARKLGRPVLEGQSLRAMGIIHWRTGRVDSAGELLTDAIKLFQQLSDDDEIAKTQDNLGSIDRERGRMESARERFLIALAIHEKSGNPLARAKTLTNLAGLHWDHAEMDKARKLFEEALSIFSQAEDRGREGIVRGHLAVLHHAQGRIAEAQRLYEEALRLHRECGNRRFEGQVVNNLAMLHQEQGQLDVSHLLLLQALQIHSDFANRLDEAITLSNLAEYHERHGDLAKTRTLLEEALGIFEKLEHSRHQAVILSNLAELYSRENRLEKAESFLLRAQGLHRDTGDRRGEGVTLGHLATLRRKQGRLESAADLIQEALSLLRKLRDRRLEGILLAHQADLQRQTAPALKPADLQPLFRRSLRLLSSVKDKQELARLACFRGHFRLSENRSARGLLRRARVLHQELKVADGGEISQRIQALQRAQIAFEAGQTHRLYRGELTEELPGSLRRWLEKEGRFPGTRSQPK